MLTTLKSIEELLASPIDRAAPVELHWRGDKLDSASLHDGKGGSVSAPVVAGQPVLIDFPESAIPRAWFERERESYSLVAERRDLPRTIKAYLFGTRDISKRNFEKFRSEVLSSAGSSPLVLMVGAGQKGMGTEVLYDDPRILVAAFDIYPSPNTLFAADAHNIPLKDESVDAVCVQAVLEHVLEPSRAVSEILRVLKPGGIVYAETPFMQQVHEGAADFTRFTELGHRWLFRDFDEIERGAIGGPGLSVYWSMKYFFRGLTRSRKMANVLSVPFGLLALLDRFMPRAHILDGANGVYFMGRKAGRRLEARAIFDHYLGAQ
ncbi:class I SAM-dependent methyltransferase [Parvibaculum sp.]|uniref:class I SAM-dependent methyltransferase n=1 Tax=Parvibaculum sp. TaxID=2024848 RepID=UPI00391B38F5